MDVRAGRRREHERSREHERLRAHLRAQEQGKPREGASRAMRA